MKSLRGWIPARVLWGCLDEDRFGPCQLTGQAVKQHWFLGPIGIQFFGCLERFLNTVSSRAGISACTLPQTQLGVSIPEID